MMKVLGVKNNHVSPGFRPTAKFHYDQSTEILTVDFEMSATKCGENGLPMPDIEPTIYTTSATVSMKELRARPDWTAHQTYFLAVTTDFAFTPIFPLFVETLPLRETAPDYAARTKVNLAVGINVPFVDSTDDVFITVNLNADATDANLVVTGDLTREWSQASTSGVERVLKFPTITATAPVTVAAGGTAEIQLRVEDSAGNLQNRNTEVFVEPVFGITSGTRVQIINGTGTLQLSALGLPVGGEARVKLGWKYYPGATDVRIKVI